MNLAEKERLANEAREKEEQKEREAKEKEYREWLRDRAYKRSMTLELIGLVLLIAVTVAFLLGCAAVFALEILGYVDVSKLSMLKMTFYISLGVIAVTIVIGILYIYFGFLKEKLNNVLSVIIACAYFALAAVVIVMGIVVLASGRLSFISIVVDGDDGVIYAEHKSTVEVYELIDGTEDIVISERVNGKVVDAVSKHVSKTCDSVVTLTFDNVSEMTIPKKAFKGASLLESVTFNGTGTYTILKNAFAECYNLTTFDVGGATVQSDYETGSIVSPYTIFGGYDRVNVYVDGGKLLYLCDSINTLYVGKGSSVILRDGYIESGDAIIPTIKTAVFEDGFTFGNQEFYCAENKGFFTVKYSYYNFAEVIYLPVSVTYIPDKFFGDSGACTVNFAGTEEEWKTVTVGSENNSVYTNGNVTMKYGVQYAEST